jgi:hypothetical protein
MKVIQELVVYFQRRGKLTQKQMDKLLKQGFLAGDAPGTMSGLAEQVGQSWFFRVRGDSGGSVWGTDTYTGDSSLAAAAVHAGAVRLGETAVIKVVAVPPLSQYQGSTRNGVTTHSYGAYGSAYRIEGL